MKTKADMIKDKEKEDPDNKKKKDKDPHKEDCTNHTSERPYFPNETGFFLNYTETGCHFDSFMNGTC